MDPSIAVWVAIFASLIGAAIAIATGVWGSRRPKPKAFDFTESARRIRTAPVRPRNGAGFP